MYLTQFLIRKLTVNFVGFPNLIFLFNPILQISGWYKSLLEWVVKEQNMTNITWWTLIRTHTLPWRSLQSETKTYQDYITVITAIEGRRYPVNRGVENEEDAWFYRWALGMRFQCIAWSCQGRGWLSKQRKQQIHMTDIYWASLWRHIVKYFAYIISFSP